MEMKENSIMLRDIRETGDNIVTQKDIMRRKEWR